MAIDPPLEVTVTLSTAIYASGDLLFDAVKLENALEANSAGWWISVAVVDYDDTDSDIDLLLFDSDPGSLGTPNVALAMTDEAAAKWLATVPLVSSDYKDVGTVRLGQPDFNARKVWSKEANGKDLWLAGVSRDTGTYTSGKMTIKPGILKG